MPQNTWTALPVAHDAGLSPQRERLWGLIGGVVGSGLGVGSFLIAWLVQGEPFEQMAQSPYPDFFRRREMMPLDFYFLSTLLAGMVFQILAIFLIRRGTYPRSDGFGATLMGMILSGLGGVILFLRLWAVLH